MGLMDKQIGTLEGVFITYGGGGLLVGLAMLLSRGGNLAAWQAANPGVYTVAYINCSAAVKALSVKRPRLGGVSMTMYS